MLYIKGIASLRGVMRDKDGLRIGAATTWTGIIRADVPPALQGLKLAAREVGAMQIQNSGTLAGNLCNASPAADGMPPLLTLDAQIEVQGAAGVRLRVRTHNQKMTVAARAIAERKTFGHLS